MRQYNPEGSVLRNAQLEMLQVLKDFAEICAKHDIKWWLCSGTLLGAARHGGFIPWDDDIDVNMLEDDYKKLKKILINLESDEYFFQCTETDPEYVNVFGKFRKKKNPVVTTDKRSPYFKYQGVGIDIFFIEKSTCKAAHLAKFFYLNTQHPTQYIKNKFLRRTAIKVVQILNFYLLIPLARVIGLLCSKDEYHVCLGSGFYKSKFYLKNIFPLTEMTFEGIKFPVPKDTDSYLRDIYGNWRELPTDEQIRRSMHSPIYLKEIFGEE